MRKRATHPVTKKLALAGIALASVLVLGTGCSAGGGVGQDGDTGTEAPSPSNSESANTENNDARAAAQECVVGNWWFFEGPELDEFMTAITLGAFSVTTTGYAILTVEPDGGAAVTYDHWVNVVMMESAKSTIDRDGMDLGTYSIASDGTMTVSETTIGSVTTWVTETGGETIKTTADDPEPSIFSRGEFTCNGEELHVNVDGATAVMYREH